jgi:hypothetical protein
VAEQAFADRRIGSSAEEIAVTMTNTFIVQGRVQLRWYPG